MQTLRRFGRRVRELVFHSLCFFDLDGFSFGRAEGCVAIVIKPLEDASRDHDRIYATVILILLENPVPPRLHRVQILGTSSNSNGSAGTPGAPVAEYQLQAMKLAFERAGRNPTEVDYVELHATGMVIYFLYKKTTFDINSQAPLKEIPPKSTGSDRIFIVRRSS
jgi:hypothetical protein